jgi:hypothetical protein
MSFHYSAQDIRVDDGHILRARLQRGDGEYNDAEIDLNDHIGADNGTAANSLHCSDTFLANKQLQAISFGTARALATLPRTSASHSRAMESRSSARTYATMRATCKGAI